MPVDGWAMAMLGALALLQLLVFWYVYQYGGVAGGQSQATQSRPGDTVIICPECGLENDGEYRFCANCVTELPGVSAPGGSATPSQQRGTH